MHRRTLKRAASIVLGTICGCIAVGAGVADTDRGPSTPKPSPGRGGTDAGPAFVNWETPQVHPMDMTPDGSTLLVVNTADNRLEVFDIGSGVPVIRGAVPVGLDPVSVRARSNSQAWVVNHISDSVSIVDLTTMAVVATLRTRDEPCDVVFAGAPARAFVSCSQESVVQVFDPSAPAVPPLSISIDGEDPRALAVSPDGTKVYAAIFESGNASTVLGGGITLPASTIGFPPNVVSDPAGPYGGTNPPPNKGAGFEPPVGAGAVTPPPVSLIVRKNAAGRWMDDNAHDWTNLVSGPQSALSGRVAGWDMPDRDIAIINASSLGVTYSNGLMTMCMALGVNPATGAVALVGTEATNEIRFEPNVNGRFVRAKVALVPAGGSASVKDLNGHLDYSTPRVPLQADRDKSIGDPRGIAWNAGGTRAYVTGMGSNNVVVIDAAGNRAGIRPTITVGEGPTGLALDGPRGRLYVLNRFDASISVVDVVTELETTRVRFFDPTPPPIKTGRKHLYDTHKTSGLGQVSCASCHVDARMDRLAWDLGDPGGTRKSVAGQNLGAGIPGLAPGTTPTPFQDFHPMKGPMTTQTLQDIIGKEPHHWRGDRNGIEEFNGAFMGLLGDDVQLTAQEMQEFEDFLATITFPPNPYRNFNNSLPTSVPLGGHFASGRFAGAGGLAAGAPLPAGNAANGLTLYRSPVRRLDRGAFACVTCHTLPTGMGPDMRFSGSQFLPIPLGPMGEHHIALVSVDGTSNISTKVPQLRNMYDKVGFDATQVSNRAGFGVLHDGSVDSLARFVSEPAFTPANDQEVADLVAFLLTFAGSDLPAGSPVNPLEPPGPPSKDTHAAVGWQTTLVDASAASAAQLQLIADMRAQADLGRVGLVVKGRVGGVMRGFALKPGGTFQSDRRDETYTAAALQALARAGSELTYTVVAAGSETRIGIDRDLDGWFDRDELSVCSNPADPAKFPGGQGSVDVNGDLMLNVLDFAAFQNAFALIGDPRGDFNGDGSRDVLDFVAFQNAYALCN